jgi:threonine dehydrogenase-like Zn-dependent dehydrogenase
MRAPFMAGRFPFPVKYGYSTVGVVELGSVDLRGRTVFTLHPHQTLFDVPETAVILVPKNIPAWRAVLAANMETALNAVWDAGPGPFAKVAVVGAGVIGALTGLLLRKFSSANVTLVDINPARATVASAFGLSFATPAQAPSECELVVHASASSSGLATALNLAADEATILELSWYGNAEVSVPLGGAFHSRRLRLVSSQVGMIAPSHRRTWTHRQRLEKALSLLADSRLDVLLEAPVAFSDLPARLPGILGPGSGILCQRIDYL